MAEIIAPLYNALLQFTRNNPVSFHVPGHKNGFVWPEKGNHYFDQLLKLDLTELTGLDDLHNPQEVIAEAEALTANLYGVPKSYFLVNGSTVGNLSMILASCNPGDRVIVQRNCHKSVMHALYLAKAKPVFITPIYDVGTGFETGIQPEDLELALKKYPDSKVIILTHPNYYGTAFSLRACIELAHYRKIPVLVDEAHGAHFLLGAPFPESAIAQGADIVVHSAHKTLPAMTMGSYLHFNSNIVNKDRVEFYLKMLQSSSPSYPIMASLDLARAYLVSIMENGIQEITEDHADFRNKISKIDGITVVESQVNGAFHDPLKIIVQAEGNVSGFQLKEMLESEYIYPEMADSKNVLLVLPLALIHNKNEIVEKMKYAFRNLTGKCTKKEQQEHRANPEDLLTEITLSYHEMDHTPTVDVDFLDSLGKISAEDVIPYPPGVPLIMRGEEISYPQIERLTRLLEQGAVFQGNENIKQNKITVFNI